MSLYFETLLQIVSPCIQELTGLAIHWSYPSANTLRLEVDLSYLVEILSLTVGPHVNTLHLLLALSPHTVQTSQD